MGTKSKKLQLAVKTVKSINPEQLKNIVGGDIGLSIPTSFSARCI